MRKLLHGTWVTELRSPDGATVVVADHGAHVLSWVPAGGVEALFLSEQSRYGKDDAIRGGVPIIFPQFAERGTGKRHGFARTCAWQPTFAGIEQDHAVARFVLTETDLPSADWMHSFRLIYEIAVHGQQLQLSLTVLNSSDHKWPFNAALHTYLRVQDVSKAELFGLHGKRYIDQVPAGLDTVQQDEYLCVTGELDRIYLGAANPLTLTDGQREIEVEQEGFSDVVVWNPGTEKSATLTDMAQHEYKSFLCVEAAAVTRPVELVPGASWQGVQLLEIRK